MTTTTGKVATFYHGTRAALEVGDVLIPHGGVSDFDYVGVDNGDYVWLHDNPLMAARYGEHVYEVAPLEWVENFTEEAGHGLPPAEHEYVAPRARVVCKAAQR